MLSLVLAYHRVPGQWYTRLSVLTQTCPLLAGAARGLVAGDGVASWAGAFTGMVVASAAPQASTPPWPRQAPKRFAPVKDVPSLQVAVTVPVFCAWLALLVAAGFEAGSIAGLTRLLDSGPAPHDCTPPWPRQAPERFAPVNDVPSLRSNSH